MKTVQYTHRQCGQRYEKQVRKYDAVQLDCLGLGDVFSGKQEDYGGGKNRTEGHHYNKNHSQNTKKTVYKLQKTRINTILHVSSAHLEKKRRLRDIQHKETY